VTASGTYISESFTKQWEVVNIPTLVSSARLKGDKHGMVWCLDSLIQSTGLQCPLFIGHGRAISWWRHNWNAQLLKWTFRYSHHFTTKFHWEDSDVENYSTKQHPTPNYILLLESSFQFFKILGRVSTMWCPPQVMSWFLNPINYDIPWTLAKCWSTDLVNPRINHP
jgi:hypothetical protein